MNKKAFFLSLLMTAALMGCRFSYSGTSSTRDDSPDAEEMVDGELDLDELPSGK